jgi:hypothetical protein
VNASTIDGFNPYRITSTGIDWEVVDPDDPWSYIGYWGDHQIIYLLKFLEALTRHAPGTIESLLDREIFSYANVPYRIAPYQAIVENPRATIDYDTTLAATIEGRVRAMGTDGKLVLDADGAVYHVGLLEKLLVPLLAKLSNLVPDAGIWLNTQRPEWNDANNALVGDGISVVTLCYLRRHLSFIERLLDEQGGATAPVSVEVIEWLRWVHGVLDEEQSLLDGETISDRDRKRLMDALGEAFSTYRDAVYTAGFSGKEELAVAEVVAFCRRALEFIDHAIRANRRDDGLYHSYNLLAVSSNGQKAGVRHLYEMLEGQVAALSSGLVDAEEAVDLLARLFESRLYREAERSFMLYPERELPPFVDRNVVPEDKVHAVPLLHAIVEAKDGAGSPDAAGAIIARDALGVYRFCGDFRNAHDLGAALDRLAEQEEWAEKVARDREAALEVFESVFHHKAFTGRSGTMYGYEGLGCVYWHMVAKLLLAVQEVALRADRERQPAAVRDALVRAYYRIRAGLGFEKTVAEYGAFPTDPYSHTPPHGGAQQPGMTGQVKEEILTRFGELGVGVDDGVACFRPVMLRREEFREEAGAFCYHDVEGKAARIDVPADALAFTWCQVPVVYVLSAGPASIRVTDRDGLTAEHAGDSLDAATSRALFERSGRIARIDVAVPEIL